MPDENKIGLPQIARLLGIIIHLIFLTIGLLYASRGNWLVVGVGLLFIIGIMMGCLEFMERHKKGSSKLTNGEKALGSAFLVVALISFFLCHHAIYIQFSKKNEVIAEGNQKLNAIENLVTEYQKEADKKVQSFKVVVEGDFKQWLIKSTDALENTISDSLGKGTVDFKERNKKELKNQLNKAIENRQEIISASLELGDIETEKDIYISNARSILDNWSIVAGNMNRTYYDIDNMYAKVYAVTKQKNSDFEYSSAIESKPMNLDSPFSAFLESGIGNKLLVLLIFGGSLLMILWQYLSIKRNEPMLIRPEPDTPIIIDKDENEDDGVIELWEI
jgi:hypothetical protein